PFATMRNPLAVTALSGAVNIFSVPAVAGLVGALVAAVASVVMRYRRAVGDERLQLRWITLAAAPLPFLVVGTWLASATGHPLVLALLAGGMVVALPLGAAASITQYHLYDVDRLLSRTLS